MRLARLLPLLACCILAVRPLAAQRPDAEWRSFRTEHFRVTHTPPLAEVARRAAGYAESAWEAYRDGFTRPPDGMIDLVVTDDEDIANGFATPFPGNTIVIFAVPPTSDPAIAYNRDWYELVVTHELAHVFHRDRTGKVGSAIRTIFGRLPLAWPVFPALATPGWSVEGLATYLESRLTGEGRVNGSFHAMVLRTAALEGGLDDIDEASGTGPRWPGGMRDYIYGSLFDDFLARTFGDSVHTRIVGATAGAVLPPTLAFDHVGRRGAGRSFTDLWDAWRVTVMKDALATADSVLRLGETRTESFGGAGYYALMPRAAPRGEFVAYAEQNGRESAATVLLQPSSGSRTRLARRNQGGTDLGPASWLPDAGGLITAQLEFDGPYSVLHDLYLVGRDGSERRLTHGARLSEPDVARDGRRVLAVQRGNGTNRLVVFDLQSGTVAPVNDFDPAVQWSLPRWSPDGRTIAVTRWTLGGDHDIVLLDSAGTLKRRLTRGRALDLAPAWSPDGRYLLFSSDRTGIPNLFAWDLGDPEAPVLLEVTRLVTGAFHPDVSPDARWIYFAAYHDDGFHIERVRFEPDAWRFVEDTTEHGGAGVTPPEPAVAASVSRPYSPWPSARPRWWLPIVPEAGDDEEVDAGDFWGLLTGGGDVVGRHEYSLALGVDPGRGRAEYDIAWRYSGLGQPVLTAFASSDWDYAGYVTRSDDTRVDFLSHESAYSLLAELTPRRWRRSVSLAVGPEYTRESYEAVGDSLRLADPVDDLVGATARIGFSTAQLHPFSISREDGITASLFARRRWDVQPRVVDGIESDAGYGEAVIVASGYRSLGRAGFANRVLAARVAALLRDGPGAGSTAIGGPPGGSIATPLGPLGEVRRILPVRGYRYGVRRGTIGWSASAEYRLPLALVGRGYRLLPAFLDRISAAGFVDAADAWCRDVEIDRGRCGERAARKPQPLVGAGAEVALDLGLFFEIPLRLRAGAGVPLTHGGDGTQFYLRLGSSF